MAFEFVDDSPGRFEFVDEPQGRPLAANAGLANLISGVVGLPVETAKAAANLGIAGFGTAKGLLGGKNLPELIRSVPGDVEYVRNMLRATGIEGLSPDNPRPDSKSETLAFEFASRGGFIPGLALPAASSIVAERTLGPEFAGVGALAPQAGISAFNAARAPTLARQQSQNAVKDSTLREARQEGFVVPPSTSGGGPISKTLESFGGKAAIGQKASIKNQQVTNQLARKEIGLPKDAPITQEVLDGIRHRIAQPYREVASTSPVAAQALERLQEARLNSKLAWQEHARQGSRTVFNEAKAFDAKAELLERVINREAMKAGKPGLVGELREARRSLAKVHDVDRALNAATGDVSARLLGKAFDKGKPISGGLKTAGKFSEAFPQFARDAASVPSPDVSATNLMASGLLGLGGSQALGLPGALLAALPFARGPVRASLLSGPVQNRLLPSREPALRQAPIAPLLLQLGILNQPQP